MEVFRVSVYYKAPHGLSVVNLAAACPTGNSLHMDFKIYIYIFFFFRAVESTVLSLTGGVLFTEDVISWHIPRRVTPLVDGNFKILEMHMGINGQRLDKSQMAARGYTLSTTDFHIITELPVGGPDGYYKVGKCIILPCKTQVTGPFACFIKMP